MRPEIKQQMEGWSAADGDRIDPVAHALRRFYLRTELCPCMRKPQCLQCKLDLEQIELAWDASAP